ncbi:hypothetical protein LAD67_13675 [Escherichia coli]|nr:hypothetical protein [Escherichia coli]
MAQVHLNPRKAQTRTQRSKLPVCCEDFIRMMFFDEERRMKFLHFDNFDDALSGWRCTGYIPFFLDQET